MSKKICFVTTTPITLISFVIPTAKMMHEQLGMDIVMVCNKDDNFAKNLPDYISYYPISMKRGIDFNGTKSILKLYRIFKENKIDIVQYSTPNAALYASIAAKMANIPIRLYAQWGIRYVGFSGFKRKIFKLFEKITCNNSTDICSVSKRNMQFGILEGLYKQNKVRIIGNGGTIGVDLETYRIERKQEWRGIIRQQYGINPSDFVFGFCGRLAIDKGSAELLESFRNISTYYPNSHLLIIGSLEHNNEINSDLIDWAKDSDKVHFCGPVDNQYMAQYYSALDTLVHPTYREGFGMVIQEAGAMGIPVITTNIPGASEVMIEHESCVLVRPRDVNQLQKTMKSLIEDSTLIKNLGQNAYDRTRTRYARTIMLEFQKEYYQQLLLTDEDAEKIILSEIDIINPQLTETSKIIKVNNKTIKAFIGNKKVIAIIGSRGFASFCSTLDFPSLKLVQLTSAGFDNVPIEEFSKRKIAVSNAGTTYNIPISETVVFGILQFAKRMHKNPNNRNFKIFRHYDTITELFGKRCIILGAGNIGTSIAERLLPFGIAIDAYDPFCIEKPQYGRIIRSYEDLCQEIGKYDYVISTLPDTPKTKNFIDARILNNFNANAVFVNVGRKTIYNDEDLYIALKKKTIRGAILDIFQILPNPITNKFKRLRNVIVWPGLSAVSNEVKSRLNTHICKNLEALLNHQELHNIINTF